MRTHHALQPRTPEQASYSIGRRDGKQFLKLYRSYLHGTLAGTREPVYEGTVVESADDWRLTAVLTLAPMTLAFASLLVMLFFVFLESSILQQSHRRKTGGGTAFFIHFSTCAPIRYCAPSGPDSRPCTCVLHR